MTCPPRGQSGATGWESGPDRAPGRHPGSEPVRSPALGVQQVGLRDDARALREQTSELDRRSSRRRGRRVQHACDDEVLFPVLRHAGRPLRVEQPFGVQGRRPVGFHDCASVPQAAVGIESGRCIRSPPWAISRRFCAQWESPVAFAWRSVAARSCAFGVGIRALRVADSSSGSVARSARPFYRPLRSRAAVRRVFSPGRVDRSRYRVCPIHARSHSCSICEPHETHRCPERSRSS